MVRARLRAPFTAAWGAVDERELVLVRIEDRHGSEGFGEAAPLAGYGGPAVEDVLAALERSRDVLRDGDDRDRKELLAACASVMELPEALAAIDLALFDLACRRVGARLYRLLGGAPGAEVDVNATIASPAPAVAGAEAEQARAAGYGCVKVKVGIGEDVERVAAVREAVGPQVRVRIDANGAWSVEEALAALHGLAPLGIELCEEPVHGLDAIGRVAAASPVPIALDETTSAPGAFQRPVCAALCLKVARCGGISGLLKRARQARAIGYRIYLASTLDGPLGIAAALHAAAALRPEFHCGLATLGLFANEQGAVELREGRMSPPPGPGLGDGLLDWYG